MLKTKGLFVFHFVEVILIQSYPNEEVFPQLHLLYSFIRLLSLIYSNSFYLFFYIFFISILVDNLFIYGYVEPFNWKRLLFILFFWKKSTYIFTVLVKYFCKQQTYCFSKTRAVERGKYLLKTFELDMDTTISCHTIHCLTSKTKHTGIKKYGRKKKEEKVKMQKVKSKESLW